MRIPAHAIWRRVCAVLAVVALASLSGCASNPERSADSNNDPNKGSVTVTNQGFSASDTVKQVEADPAFRGFGAVVVS